MTDREAPVGLWQRFLEWLLHSEPVEAEPVRPERPVEYEYRYQFTAMLDSSVGGLRFQAEFELWFRCPVEERTRKEVGNALARAARDAAEEVTRRYAPTDAGNAQLEVNERLLALPPVPSARRPWGVSTITVGDDELARAREQARLVLDERQADLAHAREMRGLLALRRDVFGDPALARLWWLARNLDKVGQLPQAGQALDGIVAAVSAPQAGTRVDREAERIARLCSELLDDLDDEARKRVVEQASDYLLRVFQVCQRPDLAAGFDAAARPEAL
ncbi:hypothetical protein [Actinorugispora endophytica]|uniref:Uncharacterized protein n=1 Tax=Actinorugispora endophytica TaxID=1605990 RepID=A0A4R6UB92_9ACTN|nr:hypothetical protein [Actinorugispora endophytica]TDQ43920.1 hypothetical protein EV190_13818 [Actinorugispora endophytica]